MKISLRKYVALILAGSGLYCAACARSDVRGWLDWRGPQQDGTSLEKGLPDKWELGGANDLWHIDISAGGTPVIANGNVFALGYRGSGQDLQEGLLCAYAQ